MNKWIKELSIFPNVGAILLFAQWAFLYLWDSSFNWEVWLWRVKGGYDHSLSVIAVCALFVTIGIRLKTKRWNWVLAFGGSLFVVGFGNAMADFIIVKDYTHLNGDIFIPELGLFLWLMFQSQRKQRAKEILKYLMIGIIPYCLWYMAGSQLDFYVSPITHKIVITNLINNFWANFNEIGVWIFQVVLFLKICVSLKYNQIFINKRW